MLRVSFSPVPERVVADCWNQAFPTPPCHQTPVVIIVIVIIVIIVLYRFCFMPPRLVNKLLRLVNKLLDFSTRNVTEVH